MKHTPGPWKFDTESIYAEVPHTQARTRIVEIITFGDDQANARLIAAAPEMLEALKEIERLFKERIARGSPNHGIPSICNTLIARIEGKK